MKKRVSLLIACALLMGMTPPMVAEKVSAASVADEEIMPCYQYTSSLDTLVDITSNTATCISKVTGISGTTTKIVVTQTLQIRDGNQWRRCTSWTKTFYSYRCTFTNQYTVSSSGTYRNMTEVKVYSGSNYETIYDYSTTATY